MKNEFKPREYQRLGIDYMLDHPRCNVLASPGMGKTSMVLEMLNSRSLIDECYPVLVVGPKRVINRVWAQEVEKWDNFKDLKVSVIVGTPTQRLAAIKTKADIYTINFENIPWLHETLGENWNFKTIICDESTRIKNHRVSLAKTKTGKMALYCKGTKNARVLVGHSVKTKYWVNLSGTPTPKGVVDLWGQQWPIDFGKALGKSFDQFKRRWFRLAYGSTPQQERLEIIEGAQDEILEGIKPNTITLDAYDWFPVDRPVEINIPVELPPAILAKYKTLHKESIYQLQGETVLTAVSIAARIMKCRQFASGRMIMEDGAISDIHNEKIKALEDLVESLAGAPLIVAYHFKHDKDLLQRHFKGAVFLPSDKKQGAVEDAWNAGKIQMLLVHPQSAGHGLNLQHGGNNICIYSPDWNSEYYEQVIERIGPVRQSQSGYPRLTYVHRLYIPGTWEEIILKNLRGKNIVSEIVRKELTRYS